MKSIVVVLGVVLLCACGSSKPPPSAQQGRRLVGIPTDHRAWYRFDAPYDGGGTVPEETGTYPGTNLGMAVVPGRIGQALAWQADGQALRIPEAVLDDLQAGTLAMWVRRDANAGLRLLGKVDPGRARELGVEITSYGAINFYLDGDLQSAMYLSIGSFHHLALTWGPGGKSIFVDGRLVARSVGVAAIGDAATVTELGRAPEQPATTGSRGTLDDLRIFARELTAEEIQSLAGTQLLDELRAWYSFDGYDGGEVVPEETGAFPGTSYGIVRVPGRVGQAVAWQADGQALRIPEQALNNLPTGTLSMWVRRDSTGLVRVFSKVKPGVFDDIRVELDGDEERATVTFVLDGFLSANVAAPLGGFHHLTLTWGPTGKKIYWDGRLAAQDGWMAYVGFAGTTAEFGRNPDQPSSGGRGAVDEVRIYTRELALREVQALAGVTAFPSDVRAFYRFDDGGGATVPDETGRYPGTNDGMAVIPGVFGPALAWQADGQALIIPKTALDNLASGTVAMWVRRDSSQLLRLLAKVIPGAYSELGLEISSNQIVFDQGTTLYATTELPLGEFHHLGFTWGSAGKKIYLDGRLIAGDDQATSLGDEATTCELGRDPNRPDTTGSRGALDDLRIYGRALSAEDFQELMRETLPRPRARYRFDVPFSGGAAVPEEGGMFPGTNLGMALTVGTEGQALSWRADGQALRIPEEALDDLASGTLALWVRRDSNQPMTLLRKVDPGGATELAIDITADGTIVLDLDGVLQAPIGFPAAGFHHLAFTWGSTGKRIYVDGRLVAEAAGPADIGQTATVTELGRDPGQPAGTGSRGALDDIRIYDRALTADELALLVGKVTPSVRLDPSLNGQVLRATTTIEASAGPAVSKVELYAGGLLVGVDTAAPYRFVLDTVPLSEGRHVLVAKAYVDDLVGTSSELTVHVDRTVPDVTIVAPQAGTITREGLTLQAVAADNLLVTRVEFHVDGTLIGARTSPPYELWWDATSIADGSHTLTARAYDAAGNSRASPGVTITVDKTAPAVTLTSPQPQTLVRGTVTLEASASDLYGIDRVEFHSSHHLGTVTGPSYRMEWNTRYTADGTYPLYAKAFDEAGNYRASEPISITIDNTAPTVWITSPASNAAIRGNVSVQLSASDAVGVARVELYRGALLLGTDTSAPYSVDWDTTTVAEGSHQLSAKAYDLAGNVTTWGPLTVTVDNTAPSSALTSPSDGSVVDSSVTIQATASDAIGVSKVEFYDGSNLIGTDTSPPYAINWSTTSVPSGSQRTLTAKVFDKAGNTTLSTPVTITVDYTYPSLNLVSPGLYVHGVVNLQAFASDNLAVTKVEFYDGTTLLGVDTASPYSVSWDTTQVAAGNHTLTAKAYDPAGNVTERSRTTYVDNVAPTVQITSPRNGDLVVNTITIRADASDDVGIASVSFYDGDQLISSDSSAPYEATWNPLQKPPGEHTLTARAVDRAGNVVAHSVVVTSL